MYIYVIFIYVYINIYVIYICLCVCVGSQKDRQCVLPVISNPPVASW